MKKNIRAEDGTTLRIMTEQNPANPRNGQLTSVLENANQRTQPSIPLAASFPKKQLGDSGTRMLHGIITEEYNPQLQGVQGIRVFDEMRKSDGTVRAALLVCSLPIIRADWFVKAATDSPQDQEIANFVSHALFDWLDISWPDMVRQALLMLAFGVMPFEKVYGIKEFEGKEFVTLLKLAPRLPKSILQWELQDRTFGIQQIRQDGILAQIPGSKMLIFVNEREGDNWWGTSMIRAAYKHWYMKNTMYRIEAIAAERQGLGVPTITMPVGYTESDEKKATQAMMNLRASENSYLVLPPGYVAEFMNMGGHSTMDMQPSIEHHNKEILQSVLAQFLELGAAKASSGSRALSQDHSDLFLSAMESIASTLIAVFNSDQIPELVDLNFTGVKTYPVLDYSGIKKVDIAALGTSFSQLVTAGAITPTADDQQWLRSVMGLPPRSQEDIDDEEQDQPDRETLVEEGDIEETDDGPSEDSNDDGTAASPKKQNSKSKDVTAQSKNSGKSKVKPGKSEVAKAAPQSGKSKVKPQPQKNKASDRSMFSDGRGFMSWRPVLASEQKVNWKNIEDSMNAMEENFSAKAKSLITKAKDEFMAQMHNAITSGDARAIAALEVSFVPEYAALLRSAMNEAYEYGKSTATGEMGIASTASNPDSVASMETMAQTIAEKTAQDIETKAKIAAATELKKGTPPLQASGGIDGVLDDAIDEVVDSTAGTIVGQLINNGRNDVFAENGENIRSLQRSELLDDKTCNFCLSMDGRVVAPNDQWAQTDTFHSNCRGIWVEIMNDESNPPEITGVPNTIGDYFGGQTNLLTQPPRPIVRKDSPAAKEVARRAEAAKKK